MFQPDPKHPHSKAEANFLTSACLANRGMKWVGGQAVLTECTGTFSLIGHKAIHWKSKWRKHTRLYESGWTDFPIQPPESSNIQPELWLFLVVKWFGIAISALCFFMLVSFCFHQHTLRHKSAEGQKVETNRDSNGEDWERKKYFWFHLDNPVMEVFALFER